MLLPTTSMEVGFLSPSSSSRLVTVDSASTLAAGNRSLSPMFNQNCILLLACIHKHVHARACMLGSTQCPYPCAV